MSPLAPNLFDRRFSDLMEIGRARLPELAPEWTDHNAHDPGITLMELMAWVAEAQMYSLSRLRRDERRAYAALLGIAPAGTQGATGSIWPDRRDPNSPVTTFVKTLVIPADAVVNVAGIDTPTYRPISELLWVPGRIEKLETRSRGRKTDHTTTNERGGAAFLPFGDRAGRRDVLSMAFVCRDKAGLFGSDRKKAEGALWPIGVRVESSSDAVGVAASAVNKKRSPLDAVLVTDDSRVPLKIETDTTEGFLTTGVVLLDLDNVRISPGKFAIEFRLSGTLPRPPRLVQIEPNVIPIQQGRTIDGEVHESDGAPDWTIELENRGLRFRSDEEPVTVEVFEPRKTTWQRVDDLSISGPEEYVYELDTATGEITFGNGVNGRIPIAGSRASLKYSVSDADQGNVARNRNWQVAGFEGTFGINPDPVTGGARASGWNEQRREGRRRAREDRALISSSDIESAALALPLLEVARAWVVKPRKGEARTGVVNLVAVMSRGEQPEPDAAPETAQWLAAIRRQLAPKMPLGTRLNVIAPGYRDFTIHALIETDAGRQPSTVAEEIKKQLKERLALVASAKGAVPREPGIPLTSRDVGAWIRASEGVKKVIELELRGADGKPIPEIQVPRTGLPRWIAGASTIEVRRPQSGGSR